MAVSQASNNFTVDLALGKAFDFYVTNDTANIGGPSHAQEGDIFSILVRNQSPGAVTVTWSGMNFAGDTPPVLGSDYNDTVFVVFVYTSGYAYELIRRVYDPA